MKRHTLGQVILVAVAASAVLFGDLPAEMAIHWDAGGDSDGYASRTIGAFVLPGTMAAVFLPFLGVLLPEYAMYLLVGPLAVSAFVTTVYSFYVYRSLDGEPDATSA